MSNISRLPCVFKRVYTLPYCSNPDIALPQKHPTDFLNDVARLLNLFVRSAVPWELTPITISGGDPKVSKDAARVEYSYRGSSEYDQGSLKDHERNFVVGKAAVEAIPELGNTVNASYEDENGGGEQAPLKPGEVLAGEEGLVSRRSGVRGRAGDPRTASTEHKIGPKTQEEAHGDDLGDQTSNHNVDTSP